MGGALFTVFTPTYNRAHTLPRVYASLATQTCRDFEWVVVDDGSTDGTRDLVAGWRAAGDFPIMYQWQENAGKAAATNEGVRTASGELFLIADSDDEFGPEALERFRTHWLSIPAQERGAFTGVTALCCDAQGRVVGESFPQSPLDSDSLELYYRYGIRGEKWGFHRTEVLRAHPFPVGTGTRHFPEDVVWRAVARRYKTRFVNDVLRVYHQDAGQQLTRSSPAQWRAFRTYYARRLCEDREWLGVAPLAFYLIMVNYARFCFGEGERPASQMARLDAAALRLLWAAAAPVGIALAARDYLRERALAPASKKP